MPRLGQGAGEERWGGRGQRGLVVRKIFSGVFILHEKVSKVTAGGVDEGSRPSEWGPYSDWEEGLTHSEGGVRRTPPSALGLLWTRGAVNTLEARTARRIRPGSLSVHVWDAGDGVSTPLPLAWCLTTPLCPMHQVVWGEPRDLGEHGSSLTRSLPHPFPSFAIPRNPQGWCSSFLLPRQIPWCSFTPSPRPLPSTSRLPSDD